MAFILTSDQRCLDQDETIGTLSSEDADGNNNAKKYNRFNKQNNNVARASHCGPYDPTTATSTKTSLTNRLNILSLFFAIISRAPVT